MFISSAVQPQVNVKIDRDNIDISRGLFDLRGYFVKSHWDLIFGKLQTAIIELPIYL